MSNQIVISSGAKVRSLEGVLTGTAGIVNALGINVANGIPQLDSNAKILVSQLPNSVMEYKGTWNAATNTPTLVNGTGNQGDVYLCNVAGTTNFGAGAITFAVGDQVIYSGTIWQKAGGSTGTVTSVALTETGDALTITGSPITTSGTINIGFAGTTGQYVNGAGGLTTFPSFVSSVGLTTTSPALTITNSPITSSGNIGLNFAGTGSQYIKGDGTLATFPTTIDQAKRLITEVYNSTGATLTKGTVVYINGGQGNLPTVTKAQANSDATSAQTYGVVQSDITNMNNGFVVVFGSITDIDTQAYAVGTQLYLSGTTAGEWTSTKPSAPIHLVYVGIVVRSHPTQGVVEVRIQNGYELEELHDVAISAPVNNQGIFYNSSNDLWENKSIATALGYTPANDALVVKLAGTQTITGVKTFDAGLSLKDGVYPTPLSGYSSIGANPFGISIVTNQSSTIYRSDLGFPAAQRTYTFPNADGTIALTSNFANYVSLDGNQTIIGIKTFNNDTIFNGAVDVNNSINLNSGVFFRNNAVGSTLYTNFSILKSGSLETLTYLFTTANSSKLVFNDAANYTYTFPTTSGTLALSSDLTGYVPYTGATTNVNLGNYTLTTGNVWVTNSASNAQVNIQQTLTGNIINAGYTSIWTTGNNFYIAAGASSGGNSKSMYFDLSGLTNNTTRTFTLPDANGTLALTSNITVTSITGTSPISVAAVGTAYAISIQQASSGQNGFLSSTDWTTFNNKQGAITLTTTGSSGAATLIGNTLNIPNYGSALSGYLPLTGGTLTGGLYINPTNTGVTGLDVASNTTRFRSDNLEGFKRQLEITMGSGTLVQMVAKGFGANYGTDLAFYTATSSGTNASPAIYITGTNNRVGIKTGSPAYDLDVTGTGRFSSRINGVVGGTLYNTAGLWLQGSSATDGIAIGGTAGGDKNIDTYGGILRINSTSGNGLSITGNVGINTNSPSKLLDMVGDVYAGIGINDGTNTAVLQWHASDGFRIVTATAKPLVFFTNNAERMRITSGGGLCLGYTTDAGYQLRMSGYLYVGGNIVVGGDVTVGNLAGSGTRSVSVNAGGQLVVSSDSSLKQEDKTHKIEGLTEILQLKPRAYKWLDDIENRGEEATTEIGFFADEVVKFIPSAAPKNNNGLYGFYDRAVIAALVNAIQELSAKVSALENKS